MQPQTQQGNFPQFANPGGHTQSHPKTKSSNSSLKFFADFLNSHILVVVLQVVIIVLLVVLINPSSVFQQLDSITVINEVSRNVAVPPSEVPIVARINDGKTLPDIDTVRKANAVNAQVYKDAQDGDYVLGYSSKMIIYRLGEHKVIYQGDNPQTLLTNSQNTVINNIVKLAKSKGYIAQDSTEQPQVSVVTDPEALRKNEPEFYANAQANDFLATFASKNIVMLYRPSTDTLVNAGNFTTSITPTAL